ncbi:hypothetical protein ACP275_13G034400 [Erythranthe tilingii]
MVDNQYQTPCASAPLAPVDSHEYYIKIVLNRGTRAAAVEPELLPPPHGSKISQNLVTEVFQAEVVKLIRRQKIPRKTMHSLFNKKRYHTPLHLLRKFLIKAALGRLPFLQKQKAVM